MKLRTLLLIPGAAALLVLGACGDGPATSATPAPGQSATASKATPGGSATTPPIPADFGPAPTLGGNILKISPAHAEKVTQASTRSPNPQRPQGLCAEVTFDGLPENAQWFRIAFDGTEVTPKLTWIVATQTNPKDGKVCYAPDQGFTVGKHSAAISVQDPRNPAAATKQIVGWAFEVTQ